MQIRYLFGVAANHSLAESVARRAVLDGRRALDAGAAVADVGIGRRSSTS
jgi:hypothetical protein